MVTECLQVASAAPASTWVTTPKGNGKAANVPTTRLPGSLVVSMRAGPQHANVVVVVELVVVVVATVLVVVVSQGFGVHVLNKK
jgi:hypothetical protein